MKKNYYKKVFLEVTGGADMWGKLKIGLFNDTPITSENFRALCTGEKGIDAEGNKLHYKGTIFHRIVEDFMAQGGDITKGNGMGGTSIYGKHFQDENFSYKFNKKGMIAMANFGQPHTNQSQFFITFFAFPHLNGRSVIFGEVIDDQTETLQMIESLGTEDGQVDGKIIISNCGEF